MIEGFVNASLEPIISLSVSGPTGQTQEIQAVIDTGYNGYLTLPGTLVQELGLPFESSATAVLADGSEVKLETYVATVLWDGEARAIDAHLAENKSLAGMRLLQWYSLHVDVRDGGRVAVEEAG